MFNQSKYTIWYYCIIEYAKSQQRKKKQGIYYENHHIIPNSLGGTKDKDNMVLLTAREHYICHRLLCKMVEKAKVYKMLYALSAMRRKSSIHERNFTSKQYQILRESIVESNKLIKRKPISQETRNKLSISVKRSWENNPRRRITMSLRMTGKTVIHSHETKKKIAQSISGVKHNQERRLKKSQVQKKNWIVHKKDGSILHISDMPLFCLENGYTSSGISNLKAGRISSHFDIIKVEKF